MIERAEENPEARKARAQAYAAWLKNEQADNLHDARVKLVRRYLQNPSQPLDWPNWKEPHELWFTGHEDYWIPLAQALQAEMDAKAGKPKPAEIPPATVTEIQPTVTINTPQNVTENTPSVTINS